MSRNNQSRTIVSTCENTASAVEMYIRRCLFDPNGIMYSGIDAHTNAPFDPDFITPQKVPRRAAFDPWSYWTYEDSVLSMGLYIDALDLKYEATGDPVCLNQAKEIWDVIKSVYSCSQVHGIGSFLRPYGGYYGMSGFMEPLGTDQTSTLFSGLYRYLPYAEPQTAADIRSVMLNTLDWYEKQGFEYFYYKSFIHRYDPQDSRSTHANSFYLPAIAWAAQTDTDNPKWQGHLKERLSMFSSGNYELYPQGSSQPAFCWGSDLDMLHKILGDQFYEVFTPGLLDEAFERLLERLSTYEEPGTVRRFCPESIHPDFKPHIADDFDPQKGLGFAYTHTRHHGRYRPRHEIDFLIGLAAIGYRKEDVSGRAAEFLSHRRVVPDNFTVFLSDDYDILPDTVHLYARSVGVIMVGWWRNYWFLMKLAKDAEIYLL